MSYLSEVLKKLGWEDGFQIPIANAENKALEEEVARLTLQKVKEKTAHETSHQKLQNLENHLKYILQECEQNQSLITAHAQQLQEEDKKFHLNVSEKEKYELEIKQCGKKISEIKERTQLKTHQLERYTRKLDKLKSETDWDKEALKAWEASLQKRDDDNELIKKFSKQDERKYYELEARRQNLEIECANQKVNIRKMVNDLNNYERILERTGKTIKQQVTERNALIQQWKDSVKVLHQRDNDIDRMETQIFELQQILETENEKLEEHRTFLNNEIKNNEEMNRETYQLNVLHSKMRPELDKTIENTSFLISQAETLRRTVIRTAQKLEEERRHKKELKNDIQEKEQKLINSKKRIEILNQKNQRLKDATLTAEERTKHLEKLIDYEQKQSKSLLTDSELLQNKLFRVQQDFQELSNVGKLTKLGIQSAGTNINHLKKHNEDQKKIIIKKKEDAYELDFKIDDLQRKLLVHENVLHNDDTEELEAKLIELETKMAEHSEVKSLLKDQVNKIRDDMRRLTTLIVTDQNQLVVLKDKLQFQGLNFEGGQKQLSTLKNHIQEKQAEENILRLRVKQLSEAMKKEKTNIYSLKRFKLTLEEATQERILEIDTHKEVLLAKKRNLNEDKTRLKCDVGERRIKLDQFRKKYDITLNSLGKDDDGQTYTVTHFKIKNSQEKFFLQKEGDELEAKIKKAEHEIIAMENTLKVVNLTNAAFKQSLSPVKDDGKEMQKLKELEHEKMLVNDKVRAQRKELAKKNEEFEEIKNTLIDLQSEYENCETNLKDIEEQCLKVAYDSSSKKEKLKRAERCLKTVQKKLRSKEKEKYDRDLEVRQLKVSNESAMQRLLDMSMLYQEVAPLISRYATEYKITLPSRSSVSHLSSKSESTRSSVSSCSSEKELMVKSRSSESSASSNIAKIDLTFQI